MEPPRQLVQSATLTTFTIATNEFRGGGAERTEYHPCIAWDRLAEICGQFLSRASSSYRGPAADATTPASATRYPKGPESAEAPTADAMMGNSDCGERGRRQASTHFAPLRSGHRRDHRRGRRIPNRQLRALALRPRLRDMRWTTATTRGLRRRRGERLLDLQDAVAVMACAQPPCGGRERSEWLGRT